MLNKQIKKTIDQCVLCWLASSSAQNIPNVSPKEIFTYFNDEIIIANIASQQNEQVCISFVHIFIQKGYQIKGKAMIIDRTHRTYKAKEEKLLLMTKGNFPFASITVIQPQSIKEILAPSYILYPDTSEAKQIESARLVYKKILKEASI